MSFAHYPPTEGDFLTSKLWDKLMAPEWRRHATQPREPLSAEMERSLIRQIQTCPATLLDSSQRGARDATTGRHPSA